MIRFLLILSLLPLHVGPAAAGWNYSACARPGYSYYGASYYGNQYYAPGYYRYEPPVIVNVAAFVPFLAYQPVAFATYQPVAAPAATPLAATAPVADPCAARMTALEKRLVALEMENAHLRSSPRAEAPPTQRTEAPRGGLVQNCARCHDAAVAKEKGGDRIYFKEGALMELSDTEVLGMYRQVLAGKMPKGDKLSDEAGQAILAQLETIKAKR